MLSSGMRVFVVVSLFLSLSLTCSAQLSPQTAELSSETAQQVADIATRTLHDTGVPSASVAIVQNNRVVYAHAFGLANVTPPKPATADMAYPIGSISFALSAPCAFTQHNNPNTTALATRIHLLHAECYPPACAFSSSSLYFFHYL